jgi:glycosyltransferase involved in cell wall biosynthesis
MAESKLISFIMPAKNSSLFLQDAIYGVQNQTIGSWELIIIDDHSTDNTYNIAKKFSNEDNRINVYKNIGMGKVCALNYGYSLSKAGIIKCIDSDDMLHKEFLNQTCFKKCDALIHDAFVISSDFKKLGIAEMSSKYIKNNYKHCLKLFDSLPRWTWSFTKEIADKIFPIPENLPYEDLWFLLRIKKHTDNIIHIKKPLYYYRQHNNQTFGGVYNYSRNILIFRSERKLKYIEYLLQHYKAVWNNREDLVGILASAKEYHQLIIEYNVSIIKIIRSKLQLKLKIKIFVLRKTPWLAVLIKQNLQYIKRIKNKET